MNVFMIPTSNSPQYQYNSLTFKNSLKGAETPPPTHLIKNHIFASISVLSLCRSRKSKPFNEAQEKTTHTSTHFTSKLTNHVQETG